MQISDFQLVFRECFDDFGGISMMRGQPWVLIFAVGLAGIAIGFFTPELLYKELRYNFREILGLEKNWMPIPGPNQADGHRKRNCPDPAQTIVVITGGQSNAANLNPILSKAEGDVAVWFEGRCYEAADPILGANGTKGSIWPLLADSLAKELDRPILLINGAIGGSQFGDWVDERSGYYAALAGRISTAQAAGYEPNLIIWHQGETDAAVENNRDRLRRSMAGLFDKLLESMPKASVYLFQASKCIGAKRADGVEMVRDVQKSVADSNSRIVLGINTDILGNDYRWDTCHFNSFGRAAIIKDAVPGIITAIGMLPSLK